ncbi:MAG TPA: DUF5681 domain-containing protein [Acidobacteriaceae bacterium]|jgi:hypothetical protein|nr:DUF5681 domain-containing protein [Acidobacteriaceae bacterium]
MSDKQRPKSGDYAIGFAKPPEDHRFKAGVSGNPKGRPKGSHNVRKVLERTLLETVVINEGGRRRTITKLQATVLQLANKAASGDLGAVRLLLELARSTEEEVENRVPTDTVLPEIDQKVMQGILKRLTTRSTGGN